jgi:hypothetical protein
VKRLCIFYACLAVAAAPAFALGPHEVLLLVNEASTESVSIGSAYARDRGIPPTNVVPLNIPLEEGHAPVAIATGAFERLIWTPATNAVVARGIQHVVAWVFSTEFPVRVECDPAVSVQGLVFTRNRMPPADLVRNGRYESPLFSGPLNEKGAGNRPQTLDTMADWLGGGAPVPSMSLGYTGRRGNTAAEVRRCLDRGRQAFATAPTGTVYFVTNDDVRSKCRDWQFPGAARELRSLGVRAAVTGSFPVRCSSLAGLMVGAAEVDCGQGNTFVPGAIAEHLTSLAAAFDQEPQTKVSAWISAGACASAGTVTEPMSIWTKFPEARLFVYYASGCTAIESFYQSVRSPLQLMVLGDPLACPWGVRDRAVLNGPRSVRRGDKAAFELAVESGDGRPFIAFLWLLDGRPHDGDAMMRLDTAGLAGGRHVLRGIGRTAGILRRQAFAEIEVDILEETR